jgi:DNA-directed RNA polymerase specialized sigma24 family protein
VNLKIIKIMKNGGESHMDKHILDQYIDACALIEETEKDIQELKKKKKTIVQTNVSGSNPEFPYNPQHFKIQGTTFTLREDSQLRMEEKLLEQRKADAEKIKIQVEEWMNTVPQRMQRIIRYKIFKGFTWEQVAQRMGRDATKDSVRMEFNNFMEK